MERSCLREYTYANMKAASLTVQKLWQRLKFLKSNFKVKVKGHRAKNFGSTGKILSEGTYMCTRSRDLDSEPVKDLT